MRNKLAKLSAILMLSLVIPACTMTGSSGGSNAYWGSVAGAVPRVIDAKPQQSNAPFCDVYDPVYWSEEDTKETVAGVKGNNVAYKALCQDRK